MGGGTSSPGANTYESQRKSVDRRRYGELSKTGFQSQDAYDMAIKGMSLKQSDFTKQEQYTKQYRDGDTSGVKTRTVADVDAYNKALADSGLKYDSTFGRWSLASGVDMEAAKTDWQNYTSERKDIATAGAREARRKAAPTNLTGATGAAQDGVTTTQSPDEAKDNPLAISLIADDTSQSTASTSQSLGIY